jgi:endoglucanase
MKPILLIICLACSLQACSKPASSPDNQNPTDTNTSPIDTSSVFDTTLAFKRNAIIGRGMNIGNALEAPNEGDWGLVIKKEYVDSIATAGFNSIRFPICWSAHTSSTYPYTIDATFLSRIDEVVNWCTSDSMAAIITIHHYNDFYDNPSDTALRNRFFAIWQQLSTHYQAFNPDKLFFEVLNEPHNSLTSTVWNQLIPQIINVVRANDPSHTIIIDAPDWAYHGAITKLSIPETEQNVIVSVRYYQPYEYTHQGAHWVDGADAWLGTTWTATDAQKMTVSNDMQLIKTWVTQHKRPVTIGEFGSIIYADSASRLIWTDYVIRQFEANKFSWSYFDFGVIFKAYDIGKNCWLPGFKNALIHK